MIRWALIGLLSIAIVGCTDGRYRMRQDRAPVVPVLAHQVADAVPRAEAIRAAGNKSPYTVNGETYWVMPSAVGFEETGTASWYGAKFHGELTSNGEVFDMYKASAAHKSLPIPTFVKVTNLDNGRSMVVRVNDRGPFHSDRIIDLSYGAAVKLGFDQAGTAQVHLEVLSIEGTEDLRASTDDAYRYLQVGAFSSRDSAELRRKELQNRTTFPVFISPARFADKIVYRVRIGPIDDSKELGALENRVLEAGFKEYSRIREGVVL